MSTRRYALKMAATAAAGLVFTPMPARADQAARAAALDAFTGGRTVSDGRIRLSLPALAENGNSVGLRVSLEETPSARPERLIVLSLRNPEAVIAEFRFGPLAILDDLETRIRLARSQPVTVVAAYSDGTFWQASADIVVTQAACVEGLI